MFVAGGGELGLEADALVESMWVLAGLGGEAVIVIATLRGKIYAVHCYQFPVTFPSDRPERSDIGYLADSGEAS